MIEADLAAGERQSYRFSLTGDAFTFAARATVIAARGSERRLSFFIDESGVPRFQVGSPAGPKSPAT